MLLFNVLEMIPTPQPTIRSGQIILTVLGTKGHIKEVQFPIRIIYPDQKFQGLTHADNKLKIRTLL